MSPKIEAKTILAQRALRQRQIIDAAMSLALSGGAPAVTVSAVALKAGISRSSIYEYFSSSADLIADLVVEEMTHYRDRLQAAVVDELDPYRSIELWIAEALKYVADGRHILIKSLNSASTPEYRREEIIHGHRALMSTIMNPLRSLGFTDPMVALHFLQSTIDAASIRIDSGNEPELEIQNAQRYALAGLRALLD